MTFEEILAEAKKICGRMEWHSFRAVPGENRFGTYNIPKKDFDGADEMAFYRHYPLEITFFYRESKQKGDFEGEKKFEAAAAGAGEFSCTMGYDSTNNLFYTQYVFDITEHIEEE